MTMVQSGDCRQYQRHFPSGVVLAAAAELMLIALLLRWSDAPGFFAASIACSLCAVQLGVIFIARFRLNTLHVCKLARHAEFSTKPVLIADANGRIKWINTSFGRMTGYNLSEIVGMTFAMVLHGRDTDTRTVERIREKMRAEQPFEVEIAEFDRSGKALWVASSGEPIRDAHGLVTHYYITQTDLTAQRHHVEQLTEMQATEQLIELHESAIETSINGDLQMEHNIDAHENGQVASGAYALHGSAALNSANRVSELAHQLEALDTTDSRDQLQTLVEGLKAEVEQCIAHVPALTDKARVAPQT